MSKPILDVAKELAAAHHNEDPSTTRVYLSSHDTEIRLVEVAGSVESTGELFPVHFAKDREVPYTSVVVLLSEDEWQQVENGALALPKGWDKASLTRLI